MGPLIILTLPKQPVKLPVSCPTSKYDNLFEYAFSLVQMVSTTRVMVGCPYIRGVRETIQ